MRKQKSNDNKEKMEQYQSMDGYKIPFLMSSSNMYEARL